MDEADNDMQVESTETEMQVEYTETEQGIVNRTVQITSSSNNKDILFNNTYTREDGTPNKALANALEQCVKIHDDLTQASSVLFVPNKTK